jgi:hypothetical protein
MGRGRFATPIPRAAHGGHKRRTKIALAGNHIQHNQRGEHSSDDNHYLRLAVMIGLSLISMSALMYAVVNTLGDVYNSLNQVYMAGLMTAPMVVIEMLLMSGMYRHKKLNVLLIAGSCVVGIAFFLFIRQQTAISDRQFLRSMIPHHLRLNVNG